MDILLVSAAIFGAFVSFRWAAKSSRKIRDREERKFIDHRIELYKANVLINKADTEVDPDIRHELLLGASEKVKNALDSSYDLERKA